MTEQFLTFNKNEYKYIVKRGQTDKQTFTQRKTDLQTYTRTHRKKDIYDIDMDID